MHEVLWCLYGRDLQPAGFVLCSACQGIEALVEWFPVSRVNEATAHLAAGKARIRIVLEDDPARAGAGTSDYGRRARARLAMSHRPGIVLTVNIMLSVKGLQT